MANQEHIITSHNTLNYSGMLFEKGRKEVPFSTAIGGKSKTTQSFNFPTSVEFENAGGTSQPAISETASLTAPERTKVDREQKYNCCQIFHEALEVTYAKQSTMDQLSGLNIAGQEANPANELDFQVARKMDKIARDIEYTFLNGTYQDGVDDSTAYKTRGIITAVTTNKLAETSKPLTYWAIAELLKNMANNGASTNGLVLYTNATHIMQLNADASANGLTIVPDGREINGIKITTLMTPFGEIGLTDDFFVPAGTALLANINYCNPVYMPVPGKGNFFLEQLSKTGASDAYQLYGQLGLDYGAEWLHGKITGLSTSFTRPEYSKRVYVSGGTIQTTQAAATSAKTK